MKYARYSHAAIEFNGSIYVAGGRGAGGALNIVECFNVQNNKWKTCASLNIARADFTLVALHGLLYAMGGTNAPVECYDPSKNVWTLVCFYSFVSINFYIFFFNSSDRFVCQSRDNCMCH